MIRLFKVLVVVLFVGLIAVSFSVEKAAAKDRPLEFIFISFTGIDPFWAEIKRGMDDAAKALGVKATFQFADGDQSKAVNFFEAAIATGADGIAVNINNPTSFDSVTKRAIAEGIPVIAFNTDDPEGAKGNGRLAYIGQDYYEAGMLVGKTIAALKPKPKHVAAWVEVPGGTYAVQRYGGVKKVLDAEGISSELVDCGFESAASILSRMTAYLEGHPETDFTCPIGSWVATLTTTAIQEMGLEGKVRNGGFDIGKKVLGDIKKGKTVFAVDQQGYAQAYYAVVALYNLIKNGIQPFNYNTGMAIINADNIDQFLKYQKLRSGK